ncbi:GNAT family N-acetyltransferase [Seohaeicola zhoushanensis]|uniref:N-acetyltransferase n=1 Tax=Seohaeicola zhoushanensis TaxID=1569283 RepID=A0A8J3GUM2_9RHOB|nr:GNAT family N-acetyltransferase [Seohaeicola zhoushanensis]GHF35934.1 N-acetyltransferase [Seohaeicola zhoushanensis]
MPEASDILFRPATAADVPAVVALLADDVLGAGRESADLAPYHAAFEAMQSEGNNTLIVGELDGTAVATYQITFISGLSLRAARRAQVESVRVAASLRNRGAGALLMADAESRARAAGCSLIQLTSNATRADARRFYERLGFTSSHTGFKKTLG